MNDSAHRYGSVSRILHWGMALLLTLQFLKLGDRIDEGEHWIGQTLVPTHVSIGVLLLVLVLLRLTWAVVQRGRRPQPAKGIPRTGMARPFLRTDRAGRHNPRSRLRSGQTDGGLSADARLRRLRRGFLAEHDRARARQLPGAGMDRRRHAHARSRPPL